MKKAFGWTVAGCGLVLMSLTGCAGKSTTEQISPRLAELREMNFSNVHPVAIPSDGERIPHLIEGANPDGRGDYKAAFGSKGCWVILTYSDPVAGDGDRTPHWSFFPPGAQHRVRVRSSQELKSHFPGC